MSIDRPLYQHHPTRDWSLDATKMGLNEKKVDGLPWREVFVAMEALEDGAVANKDEQRQVGHYWLRAPERAPTVLQGKQIGEARHKTLDFADAIVAGTITAEGGEQFTDVVHIGIGGSALGPQLMVSALGTCEGLRLHFLDNTDPDGIAKVLASVRENTRTTLFVVVSKSGGTAETLNGMALAREFVESQGLTWASRSVAVTGDGSRLHKIASDEGWLLILPMWDWVGGRTSITASVGLLPAALSGIDCSDFLLGARDMDEWTRTPSWHDNPAALLAACWYFVGGGTGEKAMVVLPYRDQLLLFSRYLQQLVMESLGKRLNRNGEQVHQGLVVYGNKGSTDQHAYVQQLRDGRNDFFAAFIGVLSDGEGSNADLGEGHRASDHLLGFLLGTRRALDQANRKSLTLMLPKVDAYEMGALIALFERAVGLYAELINVNAYHQPGVEAGKKAAKEALELSKALSAQLKKGPGTAEELSKAVGGDLTEVFTVLRHLHQTARANRSNMSVDAVFSAK